MAQSGSGGSPCGGGGYSKWRRAAWLLDPEAGASYERERREIDAVIRSLDQLRVDAGISKAEPARRIGCNPSSIRRLFTARRARPELPLIVSIADELGARVEVSSPGSATAGRTRASGECPRNRICELMVWLLLGLMCTGRSRSRRCSIR
jgi:hypothetical protein